MKRLLMINKIEELKINNVDYYILGLKNYNNLNVYEFELDNILKYLNKNIVVSLNKLFKSSELDNIKSILKKFENKIYGIIFSDPSIYKIVNDNNINVKLIYGNTKATTNYNTINMWSSLGVKDIIISQDITLNEIIEISNNTNCNLYVNIYGRNIVSTSKRMFLKNYFEHINNKNNNNLYTMKNNKYDFKIYETNDESVILSEIVNGLKYIDILNKNNINNFIFNSYDVENIDNVINTLYDDNINFTGFFEKETIYKVGDIND